MRRPDFFFVGHPRSGSGLLDAWLAGHPDVFMARKELHFFGRDIRYHDPPRTEANYLAHFRRARGERRVGESSTWLLSSATAAEEIAAFAPEARILLMLREPVSWLHSLHSHLVFTGDEDIADFAEALAAEEDRRAGRRMPRWTIPANALFYRANTDYAAQVGRFFRVFGRDRVLVLIFDDFREDPVAVYDRVLRFLDLPTDFPGRAEVLAPSKRARNSNRTVWSRRVRDFVNRPRHRRVLEGVDPAPIPGAGLAIRVMRRLNIRYTDRAPMDPALRRELRRELRPRVEALEALLDRPLPAWKDEG